VAPGLRFALAAAALFAFKSAAQTPSRPEFEVASIKLNTDCVNGAGNEQHSPGRFGVECVSPRDYIRGAYGAYGNGRNRNVRPPEVLGGAKWVDTDHYDIIAKTRGDTGLDEMYGPMMRALLEDRFQLKIHTETRELPVYMLAVAKGGAKLSPSKDGSCVPLDVKNVLQSPPPPNYCGRMTTKGSATRIVDGFGTTLAEFTDRIFKDTLDRPVIDQTGLTGLFDIHLEYVLETGTGASPEASGVNGGVSIFTALQEQLGLKLSPDKGPVEVLVIDHIERPSAN
jgi:uncharacterized protein (TIGR03435 family)